MPTAASPGAHGGQLSRETAACVRPPSRTVMAQCRGTFVNIGENGMIRFLPLVLLMALCVTSVAAAEPRSSTEGQRMAKRTAISLGRAVVGPVIGGTLGRLVTGSPAGTVIGSLLSPTPTATDQQEQKARRRAMQANRAQCGRPTFCGPSPRAVEVSRARSAQPLGPAVVRRR